MPLQQDGAEKKFVEMRCGPALWKLPVKVKPAEWQFLNCFRHLVIMEAGLTIESYQVW
jgi:hypothetical protein